MDTKTLYAKLASVPPQIKSWLGSEEIVNYVNNIDDQFVLPRESSSVIKRIAQQLLIKEIAPDYFSGELATQLKLDKDKALHISSEIKKNIFFPQKTAFSAYGIDIDLLDKFQIPVIKDLSPNAVTSVIQSPEPSGTKSAPLPMAPIKPSTLSDIGWSKRPPVQATPTVKPDTLQVSQMVPTWTPASNSASGQMPVPTRITTPTPTPTSPSVKPTTSSTPPPATGEPAPVMLHEDTTFKAPEKNAAFTLGKPGAGAEVHFNPANPSQAPARAAVLEFGGLPPKPSTPKPPTPGANAIHYTEFQAGPRTVSQVAPPAPTASATPIPTPKPPVPPRPPIVPGASSSQTAPQPPKPPQPPQSPQSPQKGPIVKDFL